MSEYYPRKGDYVVVKTSGWLGLIIRIGTVSRWNHAFIYIGDDKIVEANPKGVEISPLRYERVAWNNHEELTDEQREKIVQLSLDQVGRGYSFLTIALIILRILGMKVLANSKFLLKAAEKDGYICSELVSEVYFNAGVNLLPHKPDYTTVPGDLAERLIYL